VRLPPSLRFILRPEPRQPTRCARREESAVKETQEILLSSTTRPPDRLFLGLFFRIGNQGATRNPAAPPFLEEKAPIGAEAVAAPAPSQHAMRS
jgi:hypothetical protein